MKLSKKANYFITALSAMLLLSACATIDEQTGERKDPLEGFNRVMWDFNYNAADPYAKTDWVKGWKEYVPQPIRKGLTNVANNLDEPASMVNRLLQGEFKKAIVHFHRFWINSIF